LVARQLGLAVAELFQWRKAYLEGFLVAIGANEAVVPASELQETKKAINFRSIRKLFQIDNNFFNKLDI
jgi:hypothetical protein